ncbi:sodium-dependent transporter [Candidatus Woesearchaeota archaeon]|nr:sodium-dependent transporter [Candidatus Woesearchaeota archaeon]
MPRERWPTRLTFLFAAVTSAIGLGNLWRFPYLTYKYGGGAFLLPYLIALVVAGIPLLILEFALGQKLQKGAVDAFASIKRKFSGIGWLALFVGFIVISYYAVVTVPVAGILFIAMLLRSVTLKGSLVGLSFYLKPDFSALLDSEVWVAAFSQIFFSLSVGFGVLIAYASFNKPTDDIAKNAVIVGVSDTLFSILAGFIIFGTLGFMATAQNVPVEQVAASGPGLAFVVFPEALSLMPFAAFFSMLFFLILAVIAYDSAFSLVEAIDTVVKDKTKIKREVIALAVCAIAFLSGIIFTTNAGLYFLDVIDHFVNSYTLLAVGILQCIAIGWVFGADKLRVYVNKVSEIKIGRWWNFAIKYAIPVILSFIVIIQLIKELKAPYENYPKWAIWLGWVSVVAPFVIAFLIPQKNIQKRSSGL